MVTHWQVAPIGHECVICTAEHDAHIGGMMNGRVEVGVVTNLSWQMQRNLRLRHNSTVWEDKQFSIRYFTGYLKSHTCCASPHSVLLPNPWKATSGFVSSLHPKLRGPSSSASSMSAPAEQSKGGRERERVRERVRISTAHTYLQRGWEEIGHRI